MLTTADEVFTITENSSRAREVPCITKEGGDKLMFISSHAIQYLTYTDVISLLVMGVEQNNASEVSLMWIASEDGTITESGKTINYHMFDLFMTQTKNGGITFSSERICNITNQNTMKCIQTSDKLTFYYDAVNHDGEGTIYEFGDKRTWLVDSDGSPVKNESILTVEFTPSFLYARPRFCKNWFAEMENLNSVIGTENFMTDECMDMSYMFQNCKSLTKLDVSRFNINKVYSFNYMFDNCIKLQRVYSLNTTPWEGDDASSVNMFRECKNINYPAYKASKVTKKQAYVGIGGYFTQAQMEV